ncbi:nucleoside hydrolase [Kribbella qitaiheensis]|uniref:nucleoside hydrolase n=1 Tax=Kribbella qitaiheensis TaxID=1544730 RepID=UPI00361821E8
MPSALVLDTDIGSDVDDALALATILGSPELELAGVTTVYGDVVLRARMVARVAAVAGREVGPVVPGRGEPRSGPEVWWAGHEGVLMPDLDKEQVSEDVDPIGLLAGAATVMPVGPLTNVAEALERPGQAIEQLYLMGGNFSQPDAEHNIRCDVAAAAAVFDSGVPITAVGIDQTQRVRFDHAVVARIEAAGALGELLGAEMRQFWKFTATESNAPHDPTAVLVLVEPELFTFSTGRVEVDLEGVTRFTQDAGGPHRIVTDLDPAKVARRIESRILAACEKQSD